MKKVKRTDLAWVVFVIAALAVAARVGHRPAGPVMPASVPDAGWYQSLSVRTVRLGMSGHDALESVNRSNAVTMRSGGQWDFPHIRLDPHHNVVSVSGDSLERAGQPIVEAGMSEPEIQQVLGGAGVVMTPERTVLSASRDGVTVEVTMTPTPTHTLTLSNVYLGSSAAGPP